ncbi:MAG: alanine dehydrogenase [Alphaproteobacteria bacterium]|jgi:alanine dehydrogenase
MTRRVLLLRPEELQGLVTMRDAIDIVEMGYREARAYPAISAPRRRVHSPAGVRVSNFPGGVHGLGVIGAGERPDKLNKGGDSQTKEMRGFPVHLVHDSNTGHLLSIMIGEVDEKTLGFTSVMALRTAATSGIGFRYLPRQNIKIAGLFGSAGQAANQLLALLTERRSITKVKVYSRDANNRRAFADKYSRLFNVEIEPVDSPEKVVRGSDVVHCATNTSVPLFDGNLLEPGQHVTGIIGSNIQLVRSGYRSTVRREIDDRTAERADLIVCNLRETIMTEQPGDLYEPIEQGLIEFEDIYELGELGTDLCPGRTSDDQITYHKNTNGNGVADLGISMRAYELAKEDGRGMWLDFPEPEDLPQAR